MISIRKASKNDLKEISNIFMIESSKKPYAQGWNKKNALKKIREAFKKDDLYVILSKSKIAGFVMSQINSDNQEKAYIEEIWLKPEFQGKGLGKALMKFIEHYYRNKGVKTVQLVAKRNCGAFKFYKKIGYTESKELVFMAKKIR